MLKPRHRIIPLAICAVFAVCISMVLHIAVVNYRGEQGDFARRPSSPMVGHPERANIEGLAEVSIGDGGPLIAGWYAASRNRAAVLLIHGAQADRSSVIAETRILARAGFGVLAIDLPGQGASEGRTLWGVPERQAIIEAVAWLTQRKDVDAGRIGAFGHSMGAYVLTQAAVIDRRLQALVLAACPPDIVEQNWATSGSWGLLSRLPAYWALRRSGMPLDNRPVDLIGRMSPRPILLLGGDQDGTVPEFMVRELFTRAAEPKQLWIVAGAHHGDYATVTPHDYAARLVQFFRNALLSGEDEAGSMRPDHSTKMGGEPDNDGVGLTRISERS